MKHRPTPGLRRRNAVLGPVKGLAPQSAIAKAEPYLGHAPGITGSSSADKKTTANTPTKNSGNQQYPRGTQLGTP